jgi:hypothetical protein
VGLATDPCISSGKAALNVIAVDKHQTNITKLGLGTRVPTSWYL